MAAAVVTSQISSAVSTTHIVSTRTALAAPPPYPAASTTSSNSPRSPPPPTSSATRSRRAHSQVIPQPSSSDSAPMTFKRLLRSPFEQTVRSATRSKGKSAAPGNHIPSIGAKEGADVSVTELMAREDGTKERTGMLKRFETKVALRRTRKASVAEAPSDVLPGEDLEREDSLTPQDGKDQHRFRLPRFTSFVSPSLRLASLSSPTVHLSSNDSPSPSSPPPPSSNRPLISPPAPLTSKRPSVPDATSPTSSPSSRTRKSRPAPLLPPSPSTPTLDYFAPSSAPAPTTPTRPSREPGTLTPTQSSSRNPQRQRQQLGKRSSVSTSRSSLDQPLSSPSSPSPSTSRQRSPSSPRKRSPPSSRVVTPRGFTSTSTSSLNYPPSYSTNALRRSSLDRRSPSPAVPRASSPTSPSGRPRALSPSRQQRAVSPSTLLTRHANGSTTSVSTASRPSNPMHREALRAATSLLCKEMMRPVQSTGLGIHESEEVEARLQPLARLERVWGKSGASVNGSVTQLGATGSGTAISASGEERERRLFTEALRDGYVLCQLMNKLRPGSIGRIDPREDGKLRMSNVTKFLASCSANGLSPEDHFLRDDLIEATSDSLARVAKTIIALVKCAETPVQTHSRISRGSGVLKPISTSVVVKAPPPLGSPYRPGSSFSSSRAAMSSPNLSASPNSDSPSPSKPPSSPLTTRNNTRHQWTSPPSPPPSAVGVGLPTLRSTSPDSVSSSSSDTGTLAMGGGAETDGHETPTGTSDRDEVPPILPPRSPMRPRPSERSLIASGAGESRVSVADSAMTTTNQSIASSSNLTDMTTYSSLLDTGINGNGRHSSALGAGSSNAYGKFGTMRTVTTEATSFVPSECPSMTRTEASMAAASIVATFNDDDDTADGGIDGGSPVLNQRRRGSLENVLRPRDRKPSETVPVDLSRVVEESEETNPSRGGGGSRSSNVRKSAVPANGRERIKLGQGKWPDDFFDAFQAAYAPSSPTRPIAIRKPPSRSSLTVSRSADNPRVMGHDEFAADLGALPTSPPSPLVPSPLAGRRPTHRARHSVDTPMFAPQPRDTSLLPLPRESSPDSGTTLGGGGSGSSRVGLRRNTTRSSAVTVGNRNGIYMPRRSSPEAEDGANGPEDDGGDGDNTFVTAVGIPFPLAVSSSGEYVPSPSSFNVPSSSLSESVERSSSNEHTTGTGSGSGPVSASSIASGSLQQQQARQQPPPPRGRFQSEADGASSRRWRPRPNSYDEFGVKPQRRSRFESMANLGVTSGINASASDLMARDATEGSVSRQTLVVREEGKSPTHFQFGNCIGRGQFGSVYRALNLNTGQMVAVKRIGLEGLKEEEIAQLMREVDLVKRLSHPSIVKYEGMARDENTLSIVLEYAENGSLGQTLKAFGKLNEKLVASYVVKILEGLDYLHRSDVVHCDLKAANILTTKTGNVKLSDFGVSLNLRAMEREIKDVAGTPNWMAPEVIELKGASTKSDIWSLGCTVIELLTGRPPYGDIPNAMTVMFRIVEDNCPPIPERFSEPLVAFLKECFHKDPAQRPSAEQLFEHEWLKSHWGLNKDLRPQDSIPFLRRVSADLQKNDAARHLITSLDLVDVSSPVSEFARVDGGPDDVAVSSSPGQNPFASPSPGSIPEVPQAEPDLFDMREHTFVKTTFSKPVSCRVCINPVKKGAVLCSHCSLIAHSKCAGRAPPTCDLRSKLLMHAQFAERGTADIFTLLPPPALATASASASDGLGASSSRGSLDRERTSSPQLPQSPLATASQTPPTHPPVAYKVLSSFKRSRASLSRDPMHSNSSISLGGVTPPPGSQQKQQPIKSLLSEGNVIRRKLSIILTRQREPQQQQRPLSISSISSSVSPQDSQQSNSLRSLPTAAESISSRAARIDTSVGSAATGSSSNTGPRPSSVPAPKSPSSVRPAADPATSVAAPTLRRANVYSGSDAAPPAVATSASTSAPAPTSTSNDPVASTTVITQDTQRTRRGRGQSTSKTSNGNCAIQ